MAFMRRYVMVVADVGVGWSCSCCGPSAAGLVRNAAASRAPGVRLAHSYAAPFTVPGPLLGGLAWLLSGDAVRFAEVLVVPPRSHS